MLCFLWEEPFKFPENKLVCLIKWKNIVNVTWLPKSFLGIDAFLQIVPKNEGLLCTSAQFLNQSVNQEKKTYQGIYFGVRSLRHKKWTKMLVFVENPWAHSPTMKNFAKSWGSAFWMAKQRENRYTYLFLFYLELTLSVPIKIIYSIPGIGQCRTLMRVKPISSSQRRGGT